MATITHIFKTYFPDTQGGLEEAIRQISKISLKAGFNVKVVSTSKRPTTRILDGINCQSFGESFSVFSNPVSIDLIRYFNHIIASTDIIHLHFPWPTCELLILLFNVKKPIVLTFHCDVHNNKVLKYLYTPILKKLLDKVNIIVPTSKNLMENTNILRKYYDKCHIVNLWLDEKRFENIDGPRVQIVDLVKSIGKFGLFIGVLRWYKGLYYLVEAAQNLNNMILIVGSGPLYTKLYYLIKSRNIKNVLLLGYLPDDDVKFLISKSTFVVLPSSSPAEAFGQVLLEASYFKRPMISTKLGTGTDFVNINKKTGIVVNPHNVVELNKAMRKLFDNEELAKFYGLNAFERYRNLFTEKAQGHKYINIYKSLI